MVSAIKDVVIKRLHLLRRRPTVVQGVRMVIAAGLRRRRTVL
jgi:hypothetical protein